MCVPSVVVRGRNDRWVVIGGLFKVFYDNYGVIRVRVWELKATFIIRVSIIILILNMKIPYYNTFTE